MSYLDDKIKRKPKNQALKMSMIPFKPSLLCFIVGIKHFNMSSDFFACCLKDCSGLTRKDRQWDTST
jgi:hypothetical protein